MGGAHGAEWKQRALQAAASHVVPGQKWGLKHTWGEDCEMTQKSAPRSVLSTLSKWRGLKRTLGTLSLWL